MPYLPADAPAVHPRTADWYLALPEVYRTADRNPGGSVTYPLLRYMSTLGDQLGSVWDLIDRLDHQDGGGSDLADPTTADLGWLQWLGQLAGVRLSGWEPDTLQRSRVTDASTGWKAGTKASIAAAAATVLTGEKFVQVLDHQTDVGPGTQWDICILTREAETPSDQAVIDAVIKAGAKPAGVVLHVGHTAASWDSIVTEFPTWGDIETAGSWDVIEAVGDIAPGGDLPAPPTISAVAGDSQIVVTWAAITGATSYQPYLNGVVHGAAVVGTGVTITGLTNDQTYSVEVTANNASGASAPSNTVNVQPTAAPPAAPAAPTIAGTAGDQKITLTWSAVATATSYQPYLNGTAFGGPISALTVDITGLTNGTAYTATVEALNAGGSSGPSNSVTKTPVIAAPGAPTITSHAAGLNDMQLTWGAVATAATYQPYVNGSAWGSPVAGTTVDIAGLNPNTSYNFTVTAINAGGASAPSATVTATTLVAASLLWGLSNNNLAAFDSALGSKVTAVRDFTTLSSPQPGAWVSLATGRQAVFTSMKFKLGSTIVPAQDVIDGVYDSQITAYGNWLMAHNLDGCFDHEIDGATALQGGTAQQLNDAFMHALALVRALPGWNRKIYLCLTGFDEVDRAPGYAEAMAAADGIMTDPGYSHNATPSFDSDSGAAIDYLTTNYPTQPIVIGEWGSTAAAGKADWITAAGEILKTPRYRNVIAVCYWSDADPGFDTTLVPGTAEFNAWVAEARTFAATSSTPVAAFTDAATGLAVAFDGSGSTAPGSTISSYSWDFGDGSAAGSGATPSHTYAADGTYTVTLTITNAASVTASVSHTLTVSAAPTITFVGADQAMGNGTSQTVTVPPGVLAGDGMLLCISANLTATDTFTVPAGWTQVDTQASTMKSSVYRRVASGTDHGTTVTVTVAGTTHMNVQLVAYRGTNAANPVVAHAKSITGSTSASFYVTPPSTVPDAGDVVISYWACKSSTVASWTAPAGQTVRSQAFDVATDGGHITSLVTGGGPAAAGACGGLTASTDVAAGVLAGWTIVLGP